MATLIRRSQPEEPEPAPAPERFSSSSSSPLPLPPPRTPPWRLRTTTQSFSRATVVDWPNRSAAGPRTCTRARATRAAGGRDPVHSARVARDSPSSPAESEAPDPEGGGEAPSPPPLHSSSHRAATVHADTDAYCAANTALIPPNRSISSRSRPIRPPHNATADPAAKPYDDTSANDEEGGGREERSRTSTNCHVVSARRERKWETRRSGRTSGGRGRGNGRRNSTSRAAPAPALAPPP
mmetsp:Transcript_38241/g.114466  ORF Transcript_38241/g.114466 Transcript_38241/m.114466 type:complete len:239 (+) Transcript_38241:2018-2734(+)